MKTSWIGTGLLCGALVAGCTRKLTVNPKADLEARFQAMMSGVTLVGHSASQNQEGVSAEESYIIEKVSKGPRKNNFALCSQTIPTDLIS